VTNASHQIPLRLRVALTHHRLDHEIAAGREPAASRERMLRAQQLCSPACRRCAARALREAVAETERIEHGSSARTDHAITARMPIRRAAVADLRDSLLALADTLEFAEPMSACGVARVYQLIRDGSGPLYCADSARTLVETLWWIADALPDWS